MPPPKFTITPPPAPPVEKPFSLWDFMHSKDTGAAAIRAASGMGGSIISAEPGIGTVLGGGLAGLGESAAEWIEGSPQNPARIAGEAAVGALPLGKFVKAGNIPVSTGLGAIYTGLGVGGRKIAAGTPVTDWNKEDVGHVATGGAMGGLTGLLFRKPVDPNAPPPPPPPLRGIDKDVNNFLGRPPGTPTPNISPYAPPNIQSADNPIMDLGTRIVKDEQAGPIAKQVEVAHGQANKLLTTEKTQAQKAQEKLGAEIAGGISAENKFNAKIAGAQETGEQANQKAQEKLGAELAGNISAENKFNVKAAGSQDAAIKTNEKLDADAAARDKVLEDEQKLRDAGAEWTDPSVRKGASTVVDGERVSSSQALRVPPPEEGAEGSGGTGGEGSNPNPPAFKPLAPGRKTIFANKMTALELAANNPGHTVIEKWGLYHVVRDVNSVDVPLAKNTDQVFKTWSEARGSQKLNGGKIVGSPKDGFMVVDHSDPTPEYIPKSAVPTSGKPAPAKKSALPTASQEITPQEAKDMGIEEAPRRGDNTASPAAKASLEKLLSEQPIASEGAPPVRGLSPGEERGITELGKVQEAIHGPDVQTVGNGTGEDSPLLPPPPPPEVPPPAAAAPIAPTKPKGPKTPKGGATASVPPTLTPEEAHGIAWLKADMEANGFTKSRLLPDGEYSRGAGGTRTYDDLLQVAGTNATRSQVLNAIDKGLSGAPMTPKEQSLFEGAKSLGSTWTKATMEGRPIRGSRAPSIASPGWEHRLEHSPLLPPDAGGELPVGSPKAAGLDEFPSEASPVEPPADILPTGEVQPRLPEAGAVRGVEAPTPTFKAPVQSVANDFNLNPEATPEVQAADLAAEKAKSPSLFDESVPPIEAPPPAPKRGAIPVLEKTVEDMMDQQGVTAGNLKGKTGGIAKSPVSGLVLSKKTSPIEGEGWNRAEFGPDTAPASETSIPDESNPAVLPDNAPEPPPADPINPTESMSPQEKESWIQEMLKSLDSLKPGGEGSDPTKGESTPMVAGHIAMGGLGGLTGAVSDKEHPVRGALVGGALGAIAPFTFRALNSPELEDALNVVKDKVSPALGSLNTFHNSLLLNPYSVTKKALGDVGGLIAATTENPTKGADLLRYLLSKRAGIDIGSTFVEGLHTPPTEESTGLEHMIQSGKNPMSWAGRTMGGLTKATKGILREGGFSPEEQERYTFTNKPVSRSGRAVLEAFQNNQGLQYFSPFARIGINRMGRGFERSPLGILRILGNSVDGKGDIATKALAGTLAMIAGYNLTPEDFVKNHPLEASFLVAAFGPYGVPMAFAMAAKGKDGDPVKWASAMKNTTRDLPGERLAEDLAGSPKTFVANQLSGYSNMLRPIADALDPVKRDTSGSVFNRFLANIPEVSKTLPPQGGNKLISKDLAPSVKPLKFKLE